MAKIYAEMQITAALQISSRSYFSATYLAIASRAAQRAWQLESKQLIESSRAEHQEAVLTAIIMSASSLEAAINEVCCDAVDNFNATEMGLQESVQHQIAMCWAEPLRLERLAAVPKFEFVAKLVGASQFAGKKEVAEAKYLFKLRNLLVHFRPVTVLSTGEDLEGDARSLQRHLEQKITHNPFMGEGNPFYPDRLLGHGCAEWAVLTAAQLLSTFAAATSIRKAHFLYSIANGPPETK